MPFYTGHKTNHSVKFRKMVVHFEPLWKFSHTKLGHEVKVLCMPGTTEAIQLRCIFFRFLKNVAKKGSKSAFIKKNHLKKTKLDKHHCYASESRRTFIIYIGNQEHLKLSTRTYNFSHGFWYRSSFEMSNVKLRLN